ncbi:MAG: hypothetical protein QOI28_3870 [Mycobacterium sp.]|nr:hypothetical protein [Mycobacterium sp.]
MKRLVLDGVDLAYEDRGEGHALVFLHGMGMQIEVWEPIMDLLVADHRVIAYDLRSFGRSTHRPVADARIHIRDAAAVIEQVAAGGRATVVGWSSGAGLALALAAERPDLLNGAVVFEPQFHALRYLTTPLARTFVRMNVARLQRNPRRAVDVFYEWAFAYRHGGNGWKDLPDTDKQRFYANTSAILGAFAPHPFNALMEPISTRKIRDGGVPIGYILGEDSNPFFDHIHAKLVGQIPVTRTIRVPGAAHMLPIEAPAAFADAVRQAIGSSARD